MDPDEALKRLREMADEVEKRGPAGSETGAPDAAYDLADQFAALDQWLSTGGFLPKAWGSDLLQAADADPIKDPE